jgi:large subunit ribosomal protein L35
MPKMKTKRSLVKRVKVTGKGKLMRHRSGHSHLLSSKSKPRKRRLRQATSIEGRNEKRAKKCLPNVGRSK